MWKAIKKWNQRNKKQEDKQHEIGVRAKYGLNIKEKAQILAQENVTTKLHGMWWAVEFDIEWMNEVWM